MTDNTGLTARLTAALAMRGQTPLRTTVNGGQEIEILWQTPLEDGVQVIYHNAIPDPYTGECSDVYEDALFSGVYYPERRQMDPCPEAETKRLFSLLDQLLPPAPEKDEPAGLPAVSFPPEPEWIEQPLPPGEEFEDIFRVFEETESASREEPAPDPELPPELEELFLHPETAFVEADAEELYKKGTACRSEDPAEAFSCYQKAAEQGHAKARISLAGMYYDGSAPGGVNFREAFRWYRLAAEQGEPGAQRMLGVLYDNGTAPGGKNLREAFRFFKLAAEQGDARAQALTAKMFYNGTAPGGKDHEESLRWYERAAEQGSVDAQAAAGVQHYCGQGTPVDVVKALQYFRKAAAGNHAKSALNCARIYFGGNGIPKDDSLGLKYLRQAAELGDAEAAYYYGLKVYKGENGLTADRTEGTYYLLQSAEKGFADAQFVLGHIAYQSYREGSGNAEIAREWLTKASRKGHPDASFFCGEMYRLGRCVEKNLPKALEFYAKACMKKGRRTGNACFWCGVLYYNGNGGVEKDYAKALRYFQMGEKLGDVSCSRLIGFLYYYGLGVERDFKRAFQQFSGCVEKNDAESAYYLGMMYHDGQGVPEDRSKSFECYDKAAKLGFQKAAGQCAAMYYDGDGVKKDFAMALQYAKPAAEDTKKGPGDPTAQAVCGFIYYRGFWGFPKDRKKAMDYLRRAADAGEETSQVLYGLELIKGRHIARDQEKGLEYIRKAAEKGNAQALRCLKAMGE